MNTQSFDEAIRYFSEASDCYSNTNPVKASSVYIKLAQSHLMVNHMEEAMSLARLGMDQKQELKCDEEDLIFSFDECASIFISCNCYNDVIIY